MDIRRLDNDFFHEPELRRAINAEIFDRVGNDLDNLHKEVLGAPGDYSPSDLVLEIFTRISFVNKVSINKLVNSLVARIPGSDKRRYSKDKNYHAYFRIVNPEYRVICEVRDFLEEMYNSSLDEDDDLDEFDNEESEPIENADDIGISEEKRGYLQDVLSSITDSLDENESISDQFEDALKLVDFIDSRIDELKDSVESEFSRKYREALVEFKYFVNELLFYTSCES